MTSRVESLSFPPQEPVDTIFSEIDDLVTIPKYANAPITAFQKINKTWRGFKEHFRAAHKAMKRTGALTLQDTFNRDTVAHMEQEELHQVLLASQESPDPMDITAPDTVSTSTSSIPQATNTTASTSNTSFVSDITMQTFQQQMAMMQQLMMQQMAVAPQTDSTPSSNDNKFK